LLRHKLILFCQTIALARTGLLIFAVTTGMLVFWGLFGSSALYHHWPSTADLGRVQNTHTCAITNTVSTTNSAIPLSELLIFVNRAVPERPFLLRLPTSKQSTKALSRNAATTEHHGR